MGTPRTVTGKVRDHSPDTAMRCHRDHEHVEHAGCAHLATARHSKSRYRLSMLRRRFCSSSRTRAARSATAWSSGNAAAAPWRHSMIDLIAPGLGTSPRLGRRGFTASRTLCVTNSTVVPMRAHTACSSNCRSSARLRVQRRKRLVHHSTAAPRRAPAELRARFIPPDSSCTYAFSNRREVHQLQAPGRRIGAVPPRARAQLQPETRYSRATFKPWEQRGLLDTTAVRAPSPGSRGPSKAPLPRTPYRCRAMSTGVDSRTPTVPRGNQTPEGPRASTSSSASVSRRRCHEPLRPHCASAAAACPSSLCSQRQTEWPHRVPPGKLSARPEPVEGRSDVLHSRCVIWSHPLHCRFTEESSLAPCGKGPLPREPSMGEGLTRPPRPSAPSPSATLFNGSSGVQPPEIARL